MPEDSPLPRLVQAWRAVRDRLTPRQAMERYGFTSPQLFNKYVQQLIESGHIRRRGDVPIRTRWEEAYPYEIAGREPPVSPQVPSGARLRITWPAERQKDLTVPTIRAVRWGDWLVQGVPILRLDGSAGRSGRPPDDKIPNLRAVVISNVLDVRNPPGMDDGITFLASVWERWSESDTLDYAGDFDDLAGMTRVIAMALGVDAVLDVSMSEPDIEGDR